MRIILFLLLLLLALAICAPIFFLVGGSLMGTQEIIQNLAPVLSQSKNFAHWEFIPSFPTLVSYVELLLDSPEFFVMFWNSVKLTFFILLGQMIVSVPAAWGFAKLNIPFKNSLFTLYIILMLMPFQVTMLSNYLMLDKLHLMDTSYSIILPAVFSTFPVFILHRFFAGIPDPIIEAAGIDGANKLHIFLRIGVPLSSSGITSVLVLGFLEYWNLIEQPLTFLKDKTLWPLSLYLPNISMTQAGTAFAGAVLILIPSMMVFLAGQDYLEAGIAASALKE